MTGGLQHVEGVEKQPKAPALFLAPPQAAVGALPSPPHPRGKTGTGRGR